MKVKRENSNRLKFIFDNLFPPLVRDLKIFLLIPFKFQFGKLSDLYFNFREIAYDLKDEEFVKAYERASISLVHKGTDLNKKCIEKINEDIIGSTVLDVACGRGDLLKELSNKFDAVGCDLVASKYVINSKLKFIKGSLENLPFADKYFDTVVSAHTLEHTRDLVKCISELRRVTKKRLIVVLPKERPYKFGFNFHLHFFPYSFSVYSVFGKKINMDLKNIGGDWYLIEDY